MSQRVQLRVTLALLVVGAAVLLPLYLDPGSLQHAQLPIAALCGATAAVVSGWLFTRWLGRRLLLLTRAARAIGHGDFSAALPEPEEDQLGDLGHALETLRNQLRGRIADLRDEGFKMRAILNGMREGVALVEDGVISMANPGFATLLGVEGQVEGKRPIEAARLPEMADIVREAAEARRESSREVHTGGRSLLIGAQPLGAGSQRQVVLVVVDLTEQRKLERLRRDFVANASHELRTPVAAIVAVAETLADGAADDPVARASFIDILLRHAQRLTRLTTDLLDIARLEAGYRPRTEVVSLSDAAETARATLSERATDKHIALTIDVPSVGLVAERAAIEQILTNLVDNAIKYTPDGGQITVAAQAQTDSVEITIADSGPGILPKHLPRLFERFYRVDHARSRELGGTGLGLSIVKHLVLANGGDIRVESQVGKGSKFIVTLPRAPAD